MSLASVYTFADHHSCDAAGLARVMRQAVERPEEVERVSASVRARRDELILPMATHAAQLDDVYRELERRLSSIQALRASASWRLTAPARAGKRVFKRARAKAQNP